MLILLTKQKGRDKVQERVSLAKLKWRKDETVRTGVKRRIKMAEKRQLAEQTRRKGLLKKTT